MLSARCIICVRHLGGKAKAKPPSFQQAVNSMAKLLQGSVPRKKKPNKTVAGTPAPLETILPTGAPTKGNIRRQQLLNNMFFEKITDLFSTGEVGSDLLGLNFQISKVKVAKEFNIVNVYWVPNGDENDVEIARILERNGGLLKKKLTELNVMGRMPRVEFIKDQNATKLRQVVETIDVLKHNPALLSYPEVEDQTESIPSSQETPAEDELPPLRTDIYGLKHADILSKIQSAMKKSKQRIERTISAPSPIPVTQDNTSEESKEDAARLIRNFLKKQEGIRESRVRKERKTLSEAEDFYKEEARLRAEKDFEERFDKYIPEEYNDHDDNVR